LKVLRKKFALKIENGKSCAKSDENEAEVVCGKVERNWKGTENVCGYVACQ
jgi:hypothetical protein